MPCPLPGHLPNPQIELVVLRSSSLTDGFFATNVTWEAQFYTWQCVYVNTDLPIHPTFPFPTCIHVTVLYLYIFIPALEIGSSVTLLV